MDWLMMEWLVLVLVMPLIIVVVVLLYGFVGCGLDEAGSGPSEKEAAPSNLKATALGTDTIELEWQDNAGGAATSFKVERLFPGGSPANPNPVSSPVDDTQLPDGTDHTYQVTAVLFGGNYDSDPSNDATATTHPNPPSNLKLTPQDVDQIDLEWDHVTKSNKRIDFLVEHRPTAGGVWNSVVTFTKVSDHTTYPHKDPVLLSPGSEHEYRVTALAVDGFVPHAINTPVPSTPVTGQTRTWAVAFSAALTTNQPNFNGYCLIQKISKPLKNGTKVRITLRGASVGLLTINRIYISQVDPARQPYDSLDAGPPGGLTKVVDIDLGDQPVMLGVIPSPFPDPTARTLDVDYSLDGTKDLLVAFDISNAAGQGNVKFVKLPGTGTGTNLFSRAATEPPGEAKKAHRSNTPDVPPRYITQPDVVYLVERIEVL
jgi:hypothetical protein